MDAGGSRPSSSLQSSDPRQGNKLSPTLHSLCFLLDISVLIFFVLLCLWFLIELPRSDTSSGCYIILSNPAPSARPLSDSHHARVSWETGGTIEVSDWSAMVNTCLWLAEVGQQNVTAALWQVWPVSDGWEGRGGPEPQGAQNTREPGDNSDMCHDVPWPGPWHVMTPGQPARAIMKLCLVP